MEAIDYKALVRERKTRGRRPIVRHVICLDPELYAELEEAQQEVREQIAAEQDESAPPVDRRGGGLTPRLQAQSRVDEVEARMAQVSVMGVFKALDSEKQGEHNDKVANAQESNPERINDILISAGRDIILLTFDHFEGPGGKSIELDKADLEEMLPDWSQGEVMGLANRIARASTEVYEAPKSVRLLLNSQHSDAT